MDPDLVHDQFPAGLIRHESEGEGVQGWRSGSASRAMRSGSGPACGRPQLPIMSTVRRWRRRLALDRYLNSCGIHATCRPSHLKSASGTIFPPALYTGMGPVIAALLILLSPSGTARGVIYGLGRLVGVVLVAVLVSLLTEVITVESGSPLVSASLRIALGVALLGFAVVKWLRRPKTTEDVPLPIWMASVEGMSPTGAAGLGFLLPVANPKELALTIGAGLIIGGAGLSRAATVSLALC